MTGQVDITSSVLTDPVTARGPFVTTGEFYAADRFHAATYVRGLKSLPVEVSSGLLTALDKLAHTGPVHVILAPGDPDADSEIRPFSFVNV